MKFFLSRQCEYPTGDLIVEIVIGGKDFSNPGMLAPKWRELGEGKEYSDPREVAKDAVKLRNAWKISRDKDSSTEEIYLAFGATGGFTIPLDRYSDEELFKKAEELYQAAPKCPQCGDPLPDKKKRFYHDFSDGEEFCSFNCAEINYNQAISEMD